MAPKTFRASKKIRVRVKNLGKTGFYLSNRLYCRRVRRRLRLVRRGRGVSPALMMPHAPLPLEARSGVANAAIVTAFRPDTHLSIATATDPNMRALRVAGDPEVRGLCGALDDTPIRVRLH